MENGKNDRSGQAADVRPHGSVFGTHVRPDAVVGKTVCRACGGEVAFHLRDIGARVVCGHCKRPLRVGQTLLGDDGAEQRSDGPPPFGVLVILRRGQGRLMAVAVIAAFLLVAAVGGSLTLTSAGSLVLNQGWLRWDAVDTLAAKPGIPTAQGGTSDLPLAPPDITLEAIERLLQADDLRESLVQAQVWQQMLRDYGTADSDPRMLRLASIIKRLTEQFRPKPGPPPAYLAEFRQALQELREAVIAGDLARARKVFARAESLFEAHSTELSSYGRSFLALKQRFSQLEMRQEGRAKIGELLSSADRLLREDKPLEAAEAIARAMFLALRTPMPDQEFEERNRTVQGLMKELRFARGKRAVNEAEQCQAKNDLRTRDAQLRLALDFLPDLPGDRVGDLLRRARELSNAPIAHAVDSELGREIRFRSAYESALNSYGRRTELAELADRCAQAYALLPQAGELRERQAAKVGDLILGALEAELGDLLSLPTSSREVAPGLAVAREALEKATLWKETARWRSVDEAIKSKGDEVAANVIDDANKRVKEDVAAAVRIIQPALTLGSADSRRVAERLHKQWQGELTRRADVLAQDSAWNEMRTLHQQGKSLDVWRLLGEFEKQFPASPRIAQIPAIRNQVRPAVDREVVALVAQIEDYQTRQQWPEFREAVGRMESAPLGPGQEDKVKGFRQKLEQNFAAAEQLFEDARRGTARHLGGPDDVLKYLDVLHSVLVLNPEHEGALQELKRAETRAESLARGFVLQARQAGPKSEKRYRGFLDKAILLDPEGPSGEEAKKLLAELTANS